MKLTMMGDSMESGHEGRKKKSLQLIHYILCLSEINFDKKLSYQPVLHPDVFWAYRFFEVKDWIIY